MNNIQKLKEAQKQGLRVQCKDIIGNDWMDSEHWLFTGTEDRYRIHPDDLHKFINPELKTENPEKISEKPFKFSEKSSESLEKSSEILENPKEFMEILTNIQKILLKSSKDFKFSYETQGGQIKIAVLIQKDSVKTEEDEGWISNEGNDTERWPEGYGIDPETRIQVKRRNGDIENGPAWQWAAMWCETDKHPQDITEFRIIK
jgi:hypothetical protein